MVVTETTSTDPDRLASDMLFSELRADNGECEVPDDMFDIMKDRSDGVSSLVQVDFPVVR